MKFNNSVELMGKGFLLGNEVAQRFIISTQLLCRFLMMALVGGMTWAACYHNVQRYLFER